MHYEKVIQPSGASFRCFLRSEEAFAFCWHYHPEYELTLILNATGTRYVGDHITQFKAGDLVLVGPNLPHSWKSSPRGDGSNPDRAVVVQFSGDFLGEEFFGRPEMDRLRRLLAEAAFGIHFKTNPVRRLMEKLPESDEFERILTFLDILHKLSMLDEKERLSTCVYSKPLKHSEQLRLEQVFQFINDRYTQRITAGQAAKIARMSVSNFSLFFKRATGTTFIRYVNDLRIHRACTQLTETSLKIVTICYESGFDNLSNFNRQFLKRKQISPRQYRRQFRP